MKTLNKIVEVALSLGSLAMADAITGTLTDATSGSPVKAATITLVGTDLTTQSDESGKYALNTSGTSVRQLPKSAWSQNLGLDRIQGGYSVEVRTPSGRQVEHFDSRTAGPDRKAPRPKSDGIYLVSIKTAQGTSSWVATALGHGPNPLEIAPLAPLVAQRTAGLNALKFTRDGYEIANRQIDGSGVLDVAMTRDRNLLENGHFLDSIAGWGIDQIAPAKAKISVESDGPDSGSGKALKIAIVAIDPASQYGWQVQAYNPVGMEAGKTYTLSYWIKSDLDQLIPVVIMENHTPFGHHFKGAEWAIDVTADWTFHSHTFTMSITDPDMRVNFGNMAQTVGQTFHLADVVLVPKEAPLITPLVRSSQP